MRIFITLISLCIASLLFAQQESSDVRRGNRQYNDSNYTEAEVNYRRGIDKNASSFEAYYNLGNALFRQEKYPEALEAYAQAEKLLDANDQQQKEELANRLAATYHNMGNAYYVQQQYDKAIAAYQQSLRQNPKDHETRYNLVKAMQQLQQQQNQQQQQQEQQEQQMDKETAEQILQALEQDEQETQEKLQRQQGKKRRVEKEW